jgi:putative addiction module antidote
MNAKLKITTIGNSVGVVLPRELLARLRVEKGDTLYVTELPDGIKLAAFDPEFAAKMEVAESIMRKDRDLLRRLADS